MSDQWAEVRDRLGFDVIFPRTEEIAAMNLTFGYNDVADTLYISFFIRGEPATSVDINECVYLRVSRTTRRVVGLQIEGFLIRAVHEHPQWLQLAELAGIPAEEIEKARETIDIERRREAIVTPILKELNLLAP